MFDKLKVKLYEKGFGLKEDLILKVVRGLTSPESQLFMGIRTNKFFLVKDAIENRGANANADRLKEFQNKNDDLNFPLGQALVKNQIEIAEYLIQYGANPNKVSTYNNKTSLISLIFLLESEKFKQTEILEAIKFLLNHGASTNQPYSGILPLIFAMELCPKLVSELIDRGANVVILRQTRFTTTNIKISPLKYAILKRKDDSVRTIVEHKMVNSKMLKQAQNEIQDLDLPNEIIEYLNHSIIRKLFIEEKTRELNNAIRDNDFDKVKKMVDEGAILNGNFIPQNEYPPLYCAWKHDRFEMFDYLITNGANINTPASFRIFMSTWLNEDDNSLLNKALLEKGNIQYLIDKGADVNKPMKVESVGAIIKVKFFFPLEMAVKTIEECPVNFSILIKNGAFIDLVSIDKKYYGSPLANILKNNYVTIEQLIIMLNQGVISANILQNVLEEIQELNIDNDKRTILEKASENKEAAERILDKNARDDNFLTKLFSFFPGEPSNHIVSLSESNFLGIELNRYLDNILIKYRQEKQEIKDAVTFKNRLSTLYDEYVPKVTFNKEGLEHFLNRIELIIGEDSQETELVRGVLKTVVTKNWFEEHARKGFSTNVDPFPSDILSKIAEFSSDIEVCKLYLLNQDLYIQFKTVILRQNKFENTEAEFQHLTALVGENFNNQDLQMDLYFD